MVDILLLPGMAARYSGKHFALPAKKVSFSFHYLVMNGILIFVDFSLQGCASEYKSSVTIEM